MKYVLVIYEGAADQPCDELEGSTPLQLARNVHASVLARSGIAGSLHWPAEDQAGRLEAAFGTLLGLGPAEARLLRRGPVEAMAVDSGTAGWTYAYRGNLVATDGVTLRENRVSHLSLDETHWLADALTAALAPSDIRLRVVGEGRLSATLDRLTGPVDPGDFPEEGARLSEEGPGASSDRLLWMARAEKALAGLSLNEVRVDLGENPANGLWLWGGGPPPVVTPPWAGTTTRPLMVSNSPLGRGLAALCRMEHLELGDLWADHATPALVDPEALYQALLRHDIAVVYVEAPREGGRFGEPVEKVKAIDRIDIHVLSRVVQVVNRFPGHRLMVAALPEEGVFLEETPVLLAGSGVAPDTVERWNEVECADGALGRLAAQRCLARLVGE